MEVVDVYYNSVGVSLHCLYLIYVVFVCLFIVLLYWWFVLLERDAWGFGCGLLACYSWLCTGFVRLLMLVWRCLFVSVVEVLGIVFCSLCFVISECLFCVAVVLPCGVVVLLHIVVVWFMLVFLFDLGFGCCLWLLLFMLWCWFVAIVLMLLVIVLVWLLCMYGLLYWFWLVVVMLLVLFGFIAARLGWIIVGEIGLFLILLYC